MELGEIVSRDAEVVSGELVFSGTRVPVRNLVDCLNAGGTLDGFLGAFPSVTREQASAYLRVTLAATDALREANAATNAEANAAAGAGAGAGAGGSGHEEPGEIPERAWLAAAASNPAFAFLGDPREDVYTPEDGRPFTDG